MKRETLCKYDRNSDGFHNLRQCIRRNAINHGSYTAVYVADREVVALSVWSHVQAPTEHQGASLVGVFDDTMEFPVLREMVL